MPEQRRFKKRNETFVESIVQWIEEKLLQKDEYGCGVLTIWIQDGIIQDVETDRKYKLRAKEARQCPKQTETTENQPPSEREQK